jgi:amidophosphoribosyltransferase
MAGKNCASDLLYGTDYHSHMGTEYGGMAVLGAPRHLHSVFDLELV